MAATPDFMEGLKSAMANIETQFKARYDQLAAQLNQVPAPPTPVQVPQQIDGSKVATIHQRFMEVFNNTKEGQNLSLRYQSMFKEWLVKSGHAARLQQEEERLRTQFETQNPQAVAIRKEIEIGAIEYAHDLAIRLEKGGGNGAESQSGSTT